ncbi:hypothetical protein E0Z10_g1040 [Xylaria hypoxylon]|uniref:BTB domain-containing protein n=1 Tax=Xylaria hypoxylon TaxID=37992 RepID=A0A4Z0YTM4_9PEZI|nr:hypothetical protein E0Z10_g1040 [Xylaria hypoxylon]
MAPPFKREATTPEPCMSSETLTIMSPSGKEFVLLARPVAHLSKYFRTALNGGFQEAKNRVFYLVEHCNDEVLGVFANWTYLRSSGVVYNLDKVAFMSGLTQENKVKAWLFGDYIQAPVFQNDMMQSMLMKGSGSLSDSIFRDLGPTIPNNSPLKRYFVDEFCFRLTQWPGQRPAMIGLLTATLAKKVSEKLSRVISKHQNLKGSFYGNYNWEVGASEDYEVEEE